MKNIRFVLIVYVITLFLINSSVCVAEGKLHEGWFDDYASAMFSPASISGPVKEIWRYPGECRMVADGKVFVSPQSMEVVRFKDNPFAPDGRKMYIPSTSRTELICKEIATGKDLWKYKLAKNGKESITKNKLAVFGGMTFLRTIHTDGRSLFDMKPGVIDYIKRFLRKNKRPVIKRSIIVLDTENGKELRHFPTREFPIGGFESTARIRRLGKTSSPLLEDALEQKDKVLSTFYAAGGLSYPISANIDEWTYEEADSLLNLVTCRFLPDNGMGKNVILASRKDLFHLDRGKNILSRIDPSTEKVYWETIVTSEGGDTILWHPPFIILFSQRNVITAYKIDTGRPVWRYEWPRGDETYSRTMRALKDDILLFTDPLIKREPTMAKDPKTGITYVAKSNRYLWLTKLDMKGQRIFEQELNFEAEYCQCYMSSGYIIISKHGLTVCYGPDDKADVTARPRRTSLSQEDKEKIKALHDRYTSYENSPSGNRLPICVELGKLGDKTMFEQVLADLHKAANPIGKDRYVEMLGWLQDKRAIPVLIELLDDPDGRIKHEARKALGLLLPRNILTNEQWRNWWEVHKHLFEEDSL